MDPKNMGFAKKILSMGSGKGLPIMSLALAGGIGYVGMHSMYTGIL